MASKEACEKRPVPSGPQKEAAQHVFMDADLATTGASHSLVTRDINGINGCNNGSKRRHVRNHLC